MTSTPSPPAATLLNAAHQFRAHIRHPPQHNGGDPVELSQAAEAWVTRALELSRAATDALIAYSEDAHQRGAITAEQLATRVTQAKNWHTDNQRLARNAVADVARARAQFDGDAT